MGQDQDTELQHSPAKSAGEDLQWQACLSEDLWASYSAAWGVHRVNAGTEDPDEHYFKITIPGANVGDLEIHEKESLGLSLIFLVDAT